MPFDQRILDRISKTCDELHKNGKLIPRNQLTSYYATFFDKFGPLQLAALDGKDLLDAMHDHGNRESLVYWLEFKNDDEFPGTRFGGIGGGSALKFIIYRRKETGEWTTGSPTKQRTISVDEAVDLAAQHRDQLLRGAGLLRDLPANPTEQDYDTLEHQLAEVAPTISPLGWGHKYFSLLFPEKLDDFHNTWWQQFQIIKMLRLPPKEGGRYRAAFHFVELARELDIPIWWLTASMVECFGRPHAYWRLATADDTELRPPWELLRHDNFISIGWGKTGDLTYLRDSGKRNAVRKLLDLLAEQYQHTDPKRHHARQIASFVHTAADRDIVAVMRDQTVLGVCRMLGDYYFQDGESFPHRRPIEWLDVGEWQLPVEDRKKRSFIELDDRPEVLFEIEKRIVESDGLASVERFSTPEKRVEKYKFVDLLTGISGRIQAVLERKSQVILYGPPGTGKTYWAEQAACDMAANDSFSRRFDKLDEDQRTVIFGDGDQVRGRVRFCCFHPAYGYEDFLEGYRPESENGHMTFELRAGIFRQLCEDAIAEPDRRFYLIVDEINRGDIPRIFGELLMVLEKNKRGKKILLPLTGQPFYVPPNVFVIGTMNTADRSIALLDTALRRRFGFIELMPDSALLDKTVIDGIPLRPWLDVLNQRICEHIGRDARNLQIGHAYLMENGKPIATFDKFARVVHDDIIPLLEEYCYEDHAILEQILGNELIDAESQQVRHELFERDRREDLVHALKALDPEIDATAQATEAATDDESEPEDDDDELEEGET